MRIVGLFRSSRRCRLCWWRLSRVTLDRGLDRLFSRQTYSLIENATIVADAYVRELDQLVRADTILWRRACA
jgi:nitrogen fixation/metabolism regulation signal transduction histidine kinase